MIEFPMRIWEPTGNTKWVKENGVDKEIVLHASREATLEERAHRKVLQLESIDRIEKMKERVEREDKLKRENELRRRG